MDAILKKTLALLEKNVEWLALGLGALFLLWMIYGYVVQKPVVATVAGAQVPPGDIDQRVLDGPARQLQAAMANQSVPPELRPPQDFVANLSNKLNPPQTAVAMLNTPWVGLPVPMPTFTEPKGPAEEPVNPVAALPTAAAPDSLKVEQGRSNVVIPPPQAQGNQPGNGNAIVQVVAGQNAAGQDRNWVSISAMIHTQPLNQSFINAKIPTQLSNVTILKVDLVRQEQDADGNWVNETVCPPLPTVNLMPLPDAHAPMATQVAYVQWAETPAAQQALLQPPFYPVLQADQWVVPGLPQPQVGIQVADQPFDPSRYTGDPEDLTPEQRAQYDAYQKQQREQKAAAARARAQSQQHSYQPRGPMGGPMGGPGGPGGPEVINDAQRPLELAQAAGYPGAPGFIPGAPPGYPGAPGYTGAPPGYPGAPGSPFNPGAPAGPDGQPQADYGPLSNPQATLPQGAFNPAQQPDIVIWAHDDTVVPGKTYRYKLRYLIKNPVFQTMNVCNPQSLAQQFTITSADSDWTDLVSVKSDANFFAVSASPLRNSVPVKFDIFRWKNGAWQRQTCSVNPGDMVGTVDPATKTDFSTGLMLVDVETDPRNPDDKVITLTSDSGQISKHDLVADIRSPEHRRLNTQVNMAPKPGAPGSTPTPGPSASAVPQ